LFWKRLAGVDAFAEYEKLSSAPQVEFDSLQSGQIRLTWKRPTLTGPNSQLSGYKVACFDQANFAPNYVINCSVESISERDGLVKAVLSDLSLTSPVYSSVQIVRTFNGDNVTDDLYSDAVGYCAGRL
jgi:hypothetical protein